MRRDTVYNTNAMECIIELWVIIVPNITDEFHQYLSKGRNLRENMEESPPKPPPINHHHNHPFLHLPPPHPFAVMVRKSLPYILSNPFYTK